MISQVADDQLRRYLAYGFPMANCTKGGEAFVNIDHVRVIYCDSPRASSSGLVKKTR